MEYDVEIKPTKLVKGQGLAKILTKIKLSGFKSSCDGRTVRAGYGNRT